MSSRKSCRRASTADTRPTSGGREHAAIQQYQELAETTEPGAIRDLFSSLAAEETEHKAELEKQYYDVVHSGGV